MYSAAVMVPLFVSEASTPKYAWQDDLWPQNYNARAH